LTDAVGRTWEWSTPGRVTTSRVQVPDGVYRLEVSAPNARPHATAGLRVNGEDGADAGLITLLPRLVIEGRLADDEGTPIVGAELLGPAGETMALTAIDGTFRVEVESEQLPPFIMVRAKGYASEEIAVPDRRAPLDLGTLFLARGAALLLRVTFDHAADDPSHGVTVSIRRRPNGLAVAEQPLGDDSTVLLEGLAAGRHVLLLQGTQPLERYGEFIEVEPSTHSTHEITISPVSLSGSVYFGAQPLEDGTIEISPRVNTWSAQLVLDRDGEFGGTLWQRGQMAAIVEGGMLRAPFVDETEIVSSEAEWIVVIPNRSFAGIVSDANTGRGIAGARVQYESIGTRMRLSSFVRTDDAGRYEITGVAQGSLQLRASAPGYLPSDATNVSVEPHEPSREYSFSLKPGSRITVRVLDGSGNPIHRAIVAEGIGEGTPATRHETNLAGEVVIPVDRNSIRKLHILPREGSFSVAAIRDTDSSPVTIRVPAGTSSLVIRAKSSDNEPIANLRFLARYNGELLTEEFWTLVTHYQGLALVTDATGTARHPRLPPGSCELWPYQSSAEGRAISFNPDLSAPAARLELIPGAEQTVTLTFAKRGL
jgi:hypothetical protein